MMKKWKKKIGWSAGVLILCVAGLAGCGKGKAADEYLGECITEMKESPESLADVLEQGIQESDALFVNSFPEELKEPYEEFLVQALKQVEFKIKDAKKGDNDTYKVQVYFEPLDITAAVKEGDNAYVSTMKSADLVQEVSAILKQDAALLEGGAKRAETVQSVTLKQKDGDFEVTDDSLTKLAALALSGYMDPYNTVADVFDTRSFVQAYLDVCLKGETAPYMEHTGKTQEEALALYEMVFEGEAEYAEIGFSEDQKSRYINGMKKVMSSCQYEIGIPKKDASQNYVMEVKVTPNNSMLEMGNELNAGTYYSEEEVREAMIGLVEKYGDSPVYGEETSVSFTWNLTTALSAAEDNTEIGNLMETIIPEPQF